ncbi:MAG: HAMP domain-containing histidine kinase [Bacteroidales bacterium]|mgnify:CR=1 FL=1|nr:HAMP domain-containing histidine kinase [Bacteroidales bacterium]
MSLKKLNLLALLAFISLLGVVVMQVYWVQNAIRLKEDHFNRSVDIAMKTVLNRFLELNTGENLRKLTMNETCVNEKTDISDVISPSLLDSLLRTEFKCLKLTAGYEYAVYSKMNHRIAFGNVVQYKEEIFTSEHQQSLEALYKPGPYMLSVYFPEKTSRMLQGILGWMLLSALFLVGVMTSFWYTLRMVYLQKRWSEMKSDFINNMTHEFKTPIATIGVASEMLFKDEVNRDTGRIKKYVSVIQTENKRLQNQVDQVLQSATLEKGNISLRKKPTDVQQLIAEIVEVFQLRVSEKGGKIQFEPLATMPILQADRDHLTNVLANLMDNAIKYSNESPMITIRCFNQKNRLIIEFGDKGMGIRREDQKLIFRNFYRVHTGDVHDVKGFGIGLFYVQKIVELHDGIVELDSEPGKGSTFRLIFSMIDSKQVQNELD